MGMKTAFFPYSETQTGGCLMQGPNYEPTDKGTNLPMVERLTTRFRASSKSREKLFFLKQV